MFEALLHTLKAAFLAVPMVIYPGAPPETPHAHDIRKFMVADVIVAETAASDSPLDPEHLAALVAVTIMYESALEYFVHAGMPTHIGPQDGGRARCLGQVHKSGILDKAAWLATGGLDEEATARCVRAILGAFEYHRKRCRIRPEGGRLSEAQANVLFHGYWKGINPCVTHTKSAVRAKRWKKMLESLRWNKHRLKKTKSRQTAAR